MPIINVDALIYFKTGRWAVSQHIENLNILGFQLYQFLDLSNILNEQSNISVNKKTTYNRK